VLTIPQGHLGRSPGTRTFPTPPEDTWPTPASTLLTGTRGTITAHEWPHEHPRYVALVAHGYGEHVGRYAELAAVLVADGAAVFGPDHQGHGTSAGERVLIEDFEDVVTDLHAVAELARATHPGVPLVLIGHSMGGLIASRFAQRHGAELTALVLSGPVIGAWKLPGRLLALDEIPDTPISPAALSRDPAVGTAYAADPLVWHGPMKRPTLEAFAQTLETVAESGTSAPPLLWLHGRRRPARPAHRQPCRRGAVERRRVDRARVSGRPARGVPRDEPGGGLRGPDPFPGRGVEGTTRSA
jgi:acylglycerol lipase